MLRLLSHLQKQLLQRKLNEFIMKQIVRAISMRPRADLQFSLYQLSLRHGNMLGGLAMFYGFS